MNSEIVISIKPQFAQLIVERKKNHEFRKYKAKNNITKMWIYVTTPIAELKYIAEVGEMITFPHKIVLGGVGNQEFNEGLKKAHYAFPILHLDEITGGISLHELKTKYHFIPPQSFIYLEKFPLLIQYMQSKQVQRLF